MLQATLSRRELVVMAMFVNGATFSQIAFWLGLSEGTVRGYRKRAIEKFRDVGFVGPTDKLSLGVVMNAEPRTWCLSQGVAA